MLYITETVKFNQIIYTILQSIDTLAPLTVIYDKLYWIEEKKLPV